MSSGADQSFDQCFEIIVSLLVAMVEVSTKFVPNSIKKLRATFNIIFWYPSRAFCKIWTGLPVNIFNVSLNYNIPNIRKKLNELQADNQYKIWLYIFLVIFFLHASIVLSVSSCENSWAYIQNRHVLNFH